MPQPSSVKQDRIAAALTSLPDIASEPAFQALLHATALACERPIAWISLIDSNRHWCKAGRGLDGMVHIPREHSFCHYMAPEGDLLEIPDTSLDSRFANNPLVCGAQGLRYYAAMTLRLSNGQRIGSLCVLGRESGKLDQAQRDLLKHLSIVAVGLLEPQLIEHTMDGQSVRFQTLCEASPLGVFATDAQGARTYTNRQCQAILGMSNKETAGHDWAGHLHPDDKAGIFNEWQRTTQLNLDFDMQFRIEHPDGRIRHVRAVTRPIISDGGLLEGHVGSVDDVTERVSLINELADQHELLHGTLQSICDAVITSDAQGLVTWLNPAAEVMTGWLCADVIGRPVEQAFNVINQETRLPVDSPVERCLTTGTRAGLANHNVLVSREGKHVGVEDSASPIRNASGKQLGAVLVLHDVTEQRRLSAEMSHRATHDTLTGLFNRAEFESILQQTLDEACERQSNDALLFIDLDQFKLVNDACGHSAGDLLLLKIAQLLRRTLRAEDTLARLGGDEFGVILENCTSEQAECIAQKICDQMNVFRFAHGTQRFRIGTSIGLVPIDQHWASTADILQAADTCCYAAKAAGRNRVHVWLDTDEAGHARRDDLQWTARLENALDENLFILHAQRIESLQKAPCGVHAEVLIRLRDTDGSLIAPHMFLPAAERFSLATRIDRWVLAQTIDRLQELPDIGCVDTLCINLSGQSIGDSNFHHSAIKLLSASGADICRRICLEITETAAVTNVAEATVFINRVRALGVRVALDDFGAGASSFGYLKTMTVDVLKIDGQFITNLIDDPLDDAAVRCFVDVARVMKLKTVAEFVDTQKVTEHVRSIGIDYAQGYHLHEPEAMSVVLNSSRLALTS